MSSKSRISVFEIIADSSLTGAPRHLLTLMSGIDRVKFIPTVIAPPGPLLDELKKRKVPVFQVPMSGRSYIPAVNAIKKLLKKYDPDVVHTHGQRAGLVGRLAARDLPIKIVHTEHTYTKEFRLHNPLLHVGHLRAMKVLSQFTDHTIAVSKAVKEFLVKNGLSKETKTSVVYNGIVPLKKKVGENEIDAFKQEHGLTKKDIVIGTIGSFNEQKDTKTLIEAIAKMLKKSPTIKLVLVGRGHLRRRLEKQAKRLGIEERIVFTGVLKNVLPALKSFTLFVLPSLSEAFGITLLEAMKAGIPIVATKAGGIPEIITHNHNGILVEPKDAKGLAGAMMRLLNDKKLMKKLTQNHDKTVNQFAADKMIRATEKIYTQLFK
ncbi:MAG: glycosyltransferase [Patescibacteria group bacterium]|nr:glycosyltransferase [Patescibacteria group bacterium]